MEWVFRHNNRDPNKKKKNFLNIGTTLWKLEDKEGKNVDKGE
jgi:hypothetical protein